MVYLCVIPIYHNIFQKNVEICLVVSNVLHLKRSWDEIHYFKWSSYFNVYSYHVASQMYMAVPWHTHHTSKRRKAAVAVLRDWSYLEARIPARQLPFNRHVHLHTRGAVSNERQLVWWT
jgi:hypothetical protein